MMLAKKEVDSRMGAMAWANWLRLRSRSFTTMIEHDRGFEIALHMARLWLCRAALQDSRKSSWFCFGFFFNWDTFLSMLCDSSNVNSNGDKSIYWLEWLLRYDMTVSCTEVWPYELWTVTTYLLKVIQSKILLAYQNTRQHYHHKHSQSMLASLCFASGFPHTTES